MARQGSWGRKKPNPDSVPQTVPGASTGDFNQQEPSECQDHAGLFTCTISNVKALLHITSWLGAYLCFCSFIKYLLHAGPMLHFEFLTDCAPAMY